MQDPKTMIAGLTSAYLGQPCLFPPTLKGLHYFRKKEKLWAIYTVNVTTGHDLWQIVQMTPCLKG